MVVLEIGIATAPTKGGSAPAYQSLNTSDGRSPSAGNFFPYAGKNIKRLALLDSNIEIQGVPHDHHRFYPTRELARQCP